MDGREKTGAGSFLQKLGLRPITKCSLAKFYAPAFGLASYTALSVNVMNPGLVNRLFPKSQITNVLLGCTFVGTGSYIYTREHMKAASPSLRLLYSGTSTILLTFGSILVWAVIRVIIPVNNSTFYTIAGIGSGLALIKIGTNYMDFIDGQLAKK